MENVTEETLYRERHKRIDKKYLQRERFASFLKALTGNRKLLIWGASDKSDWFFRLCRLQGIEVVGYVDENQTLFAVMGCRYTLPRKF